MPSSKIFESIAIGALTLDNRIAVATMRRSSAGKGRMTGGHLMHLAHSGAGLLTIEATAVVLEGRITCADVGLWDDGIEHARLRPTCLGSAARRSRWMMPGDGRSSCHL